MSHPLISPVQLDLLHAALDQGPSAGEAWRRWEQASDWTHQEVDGGSHRLLPSVYNNLKRWAPSEPALLRLKGLHRRAWCANTLLFNQVKPFLEMLHQEKMVPLIFKGASLANRYYASCGDRPMGDVDFLLPDGQIERALEILEQAGWVRDPAGPLAGILRYRHAIGLLHPESGSMDLHHRALWNDLRAGIDDDLWEHSHEGTWLDLPVRFAAPEDEALITCVHGWLWNPIPSIRWVADLATIIRKSQDSLDWDRLLEQAIRRQVTLRLYHALQYVEQHFKLGIPASAIQALKQAPKAFFEEKKKHS